MTISTTAVHPVVACAQRLVDALGEVAEVEPAYLSTADKERAVLVLEQAERKVAELKLRVLAVADDVAEAHGARDTVAWFAHATHADTGPVRAEVELAKALDSRYPKVRTAMAAGAVSTAQGKVITRALDALPKDVDAEIRDSAEGLLVRYADQFAPTPLRRIGRRILEVVAPEVAEAEEAKRLQREEDKACEEMFLRFRRRGDGLTDLAARLPDPLADRLRTYLEAYTNPRTDPSSTGPATTLEDRIPADRKAAHAFAALLEHLDPDQLPAHGGDATTVLVTLSYQQLLTDLATAGYLDPDLDAGANLTAEQARRLACTAKIIPVVLGGQGEVLDLGRSRRLFSPAQRKAIRLRDKRCRAEGCRSKATWCEVHHLKPWAHGGTTNLDDGICLCHFHHHRVHDHRYTHQRLPGGDIRFHRRT